MKKLFLFILSFGLMILLYLNFNSLIPANNTASSTQNTEIITTAQGIDTQGTSSSETITQSDEATTSSPENLSSLSLLNETILSNGPYGQSSLPEELTNSNIYQAINSYYTETYSKEDKEANLTPVDDAQLQTLQDNLSTIEGLEAIDLTVDQASMTLDGQTVYVPRIIFPIPYEEAQRTLPDNDLKVLTEAMTELGNRLVIIAYYQPDTKSLVVYHLTNWTNPLFTYHID